VQHCSERILCHMRVRTCQLRNAASAQLSNAASACACAPGAAGSHIQLAGRERQIQGLSERLLCLTGSLAANVAAAKHILQILHMDPSGKYDNVSTSYRGSVVCLSCSLLSRLRACFPVCFPLVCMRLI
jgi:hypothetical protein